MPGLDHKHNLQITKLDLSYSETFNQTHLADAYERLLLETDAPDMPLNGFQGHRDAPKPYQAGTWGPVASVAMITRDGRSWNEFE